MSPPPPISIFPTHSAPSLPIPVITPGIPAQTPLAKIKKLRMGWNKYISSPTHGRELTFSTFSNAKFSVLFLPIPYTTPGVSPKNPPHSKYFDFCRGFLNRNSGSGGRNWQEWSTKYCRWKKLKNLDR